MQAEEFPAATEVDGLQLLGSRYQYLRVHKSIPDVRRSRSLSARIRCIFVVAECACELQVYMLCMSDEQLDVLVTYGQLIMLDTTFDRAGRATENGAFIGKYRLATLMVRV